MEIDGPSYLNPGSEHTHVPATHCTEELDPTQLGMHGGGGAKSTTTMRDPGSTAKSGAADDDDPLPTNSVFSCAFSATRLTRTCSSAALAAARSILGQGRTTTVCTTQIQ